MRKVIIILCLFSFFYKAKAEQPPKFTDEQINEIGVQHNRLLEMHLKTMIERKLQYMDFDNFSEIVKSQKSTPFSMLSGEFIPSDEEIATTDREIELAREKLHYFFQTTSNISELYSEINNEMFRIKSQFANDNLTYNQILSMYSVAKHSSSFWYSTENGGSGIGQSLISEISEDLVQKVKISGEKIAEEDAYGAAKGGITWCASAIFGGPVGVGAYVGAVIGGAALSSLDALWSARGIDYEPLCLIDNKSDFNVDICREKAINDNDLLLCMSYYYHKWRCCRLQGFKAQGCQTFLPPKN